MNLTIISFYKFVTTIDNKLSINHWSIFYHTRITESYFWNVLDDEGKNDLAIELKELNILFYVNL
jgi:hypothetical protein